MKKIVLYFIFTLSFSVLGAQDFKIKELSQQTINKYLNHSAFKNYYLKYKAKAYNIEKELLVDHINRDFDLTNTIQNALNQNKIVLLPNYSLKVNDKGLNLNDGQILLFQENTVINLISTNKNFYSILKIENVNDVKVFYANIVGDKYTHLAKEGQWGFGIGIKSASNVSIFSPYIRETWGDGIYIGQIKNIPSTNISIHNAVIDDVRRNGISITSANGVTIKNTFIANINGNSPESAIDIEPNSINDDIKNILIHRLTTFNNKWAGILLVFEKFKSPKPKNISIKIKKHTDIGSRNGIAFHGYLNDKKTSNLQGIIKVKNLKYSNNINKYYFYNTNLSLLNINTSDKKLRSQFNSYKIK